MNSCLLLSRPSIIGLNHQVELLEIQEPQSKDDSVTDDILILASQKFGEDKGLCLGDNDENNKINEIIYEK